MGKRIYVALLFLFCSIINVCSQNFFSFIVNDIKDFAFYEDSYVCYETYIHALSFAHLRDGGSIGIFEELETYIGTENVCKLDSISMNSSSISIKKELKDCGISRKRLISEKEAMRIIKKIRKRNNICDCKSVFINRLLWRKCLGGFFYYSVPIQFENYQIMEMVSARVSPHYRDFIDIWYYIYNKETYEFKRILVYSNY